MNIENFLKIKENKEKEIFTNKIKTEEEIFTESSYERLEETEKSQKTKRVKYLSYNEKYNFFTVGLNYGAKLYHIDTHEKTLSSIDLNLPGNF
jgi:hypothetical protein